MNIEKLDKNMKVNTKIQEKNLCVYNIDDEPFELLGVQRDGDIYVRMDLNVAKSVSQSVYDLAKHTSGGRVRFKTDSKFIALFCKVPAVGTMRHMPKTGQCGFDVFADGIFTTFVAPDDETPEEFEGIHYFPDKKMREIVIGFPLYNTTNHLYLGLENGAAVEKCPPYEKKVVFYGSSITQGACASRPGSSYASITARSLGWDFLNLGFSGNAKGETAMANYIKNLKMDVFVYDYDHNAPDSAHLEKTHKPFFDIIRAQNPSLPVIFMSRPDFHNGSLEDNIKRKAVILNTFAKAMADGDKNVYFIDGNSLWGEYGYDCCTVDGCHPTDLGMWRMAEMVTNTIRRIKF